MALNPSEVECLVDTIDGALDIESVEWRAGAADRKVQNSILRLQYFLRSRTMFARLTSRSASAA